MKYAVSALLLCIAVSATGFSCRTENGSAPGDNKASASVNADAPVYGFEVVNVWPHDTKAFTQGLIFHDGVFYESTGQIGASTVRKVEPATGKVLQKIDVPPPHFGEGLALLNGKLHQLTWSTNKAFVYDVATLKKVGEFHIDGEGWGLTEDGESLILSDGSNEIRFLDPTTYAIKRTIKVFDKGQPLREINELEYIKGEIYANIWHKDRIVRIDPKNGAILGWVELKGILPTVSSLDDEAVLNGIAYDEVSDRIFVTGKLWPKLFEIRLRKP
jgi:glutamine cyclotransferase